MQHAGTLLLMLLACQAAAVSRNQAPDDLLDVWMVPHAHCDVGWLKTVEGYFADQVQYILTSVTEALYADTSRRFIWSEIKWLEMWWPHQTNATKEKFRSIVRRGQLEFVGAGWSQNDEVTPTYADIIDNQLTGHEYLRRTGLMEECPQKNRCVRFGWQIDMFAGFSGATPLLWAMAGYDGMFSRWEGTDEMRQTFVAERAFEFLWDASKALSPNRTRIWSHVINGNYGDLAGLRCGQDSDGHSWNKPDIKCTAANANLTFKWPGAPSVTRGNIEEYARMLAAFARKRSGVYQGPFLAVWGSDYLFFNASSMYRNMDKIHVEINANPAKYGMRIRYTTLAQYADHVHGLGLRFPVKGHPLDFEYGWPHAWPMNLTGNFTTQYQTGAATSRVILKQGTREASALHRAAEAAHVLETLAAARQGAEAVPPGQYRRHLSRDLMGAWDTLAILQHHDALTGTMSTHGSFPWGTVDQDCWDRVTQLCTPCEDEECEVLEDYLRRLGVANGFCADLHAESYGALAGADGPLSSAQQGSDDTVLVTNPIAVGRKVLVEATLPAQLNPSVTGTTPLVTDHTGRALVAQMGLDNRTIAWVADLPPLGWRTFYLKAGQRLGSAGAASHPTAFPKVVAHGLHGGHTLENPRLRLQFDPRGRLQEWTDAGGLTSANLTHEYMVYRTDQGGPYCLIEQHAAAPLDLPGGGFSWRGPILSGSTASWNWGDSAFGTQTLATTHVVTTGTSLDHVVRVRHDVPTLPLNHELVSRIVTDLNTSGHIHHDDSGMELFAKVDNGALPISGRYHAMVMSAVIRDEGQAPRPASPGRSLAPGARQLSVLSFHTKGVASLAPGQIEYMLGRRINGTDDQGPWPLNETTPAVIPMGLMLGVAEASEPRRLASALQMENHPRLLYGKGEASRPTGAPMGDWGLPPAVFMTHLHVRMESDAAGVNGTEVVVRLQNVREDGDTAVVKDVAALFPKAVVLRCVEKTLTLQQDRATSQRLSWLPEAGLESTGAWNCRDVELSPLDIRTFVLTLASDAYL